MPPFFKLGEPFNSPFVGNPHLMAMEEAGIEAPQVEAAMKAATAVLGEVSSSSVGGEGGGSETDKIVCATARSALNHSRDRGPARLIRLGLFVDDYRKFRRTVAMKEVLDELVAQKKGEFDARARHWASEIHGAIQAADARETAATVPWRKLLLFTGLGALVVAIFRALFSSARTYDNSDIAVAPEKMLPFIPPAPSAPRLTIAEEHRHQGSNHQGPDHQEPSHETDELE